nr:zinc finger, CCHC-type, retrotransposon Gag domain protein [Tanacetum cinerariifolium]
REEIRKEFRTGSGSSNAGGNPLPITIHTWLERFNKEKPQSFEKATVPTSSETSTEFMQRFLRLAGFLGAAAGTDEEQAKNFQWGLRSNNNNNYSGRIPEMDVTKETGVISPTDLPILADKKPGDSGRVFAITEGQAANTS